MTSAMFSVYVYFVTPEGPRTCVPHGPFHKFAQSSRIRRPQLQISVVMQEPVGFKSRKAVNEQINFDFDSFNKGVHPNLKSRLDY
jgi:hypothetical protein